MARVLWFTGLSGAGKSTIAEALAVALRAQGKKVELVDGDAMRGELHRHLGFLAEDIQENNRLIAELSKERAAHADVVLVPVISPFKESRARAREVIGEEFAEVYVASSEATRRARDPKGLYKKVDAGEITDFIGHGGVAYEVPEHPDIALDTDTASVEESVARILAFLQK